MNWDEYSERIKKWGTTVFNLSATPSFIFDAAQAKIDVLEARVRELEKFCSHVAAYENVCLLTDLGYKYNTIISYAQRLTKKQPNPLLAAIDRATAHWKVK